MASGVKPQTSVTIYRAFSDLGAYDWSPFVTKLEFRLRIAGLPYHSQTGSLSKAPKGKVPYVEISKPGPAPTVISDSTLIINHFVEDGLLGDINAKLSTTEKVFDLALRALLEEKLYFYQTYEKWHVNYYIMRSKVLGALPYPMQIVVGLLIHRKVMASLHGQGTGRYSAEEITTFKKLIWVNVNELLVESRTKLAKTAANDAVFWALGHDEPSEADAVLFGFVVSAVVSTASPESRDIVKSFPAVMDYAQRIHDRYFPDYERLE